MRLVIVAMLLVGLPAFAAEDGTCVQSDGQTGRWNGTTADDNGCITPDEYEAMFSAENLLEVGVIDNYTVNDDGTTTLHFGHGASNGVATNPLDRSVAVNPELEPDALTVREWFHQSYGPR